MKYKQPSEPTPVTCADCLKYAVCPERSRMYPCREFKGVRYNDNKRNDTKH